MQEVLIQNHGLVVAASGQSRLILKALTLDNRVNQLGVAGSQLEATDVKIPLLGHARLGAVLTSQRRGLDREVADKDRTVELVFTEQLPDFLNQLAVAPAALFRNLKSNHIGDCL